MKNAIVLFLLVFSVSSAGAQSNSGTPAPGIERASVTELSKAMGHFARARSLLLKAIQEFDLGNSTASPDAILDSGAWRSEVIARTQDLERVLDPQPRITKGGVRYEADSRLLGEAKVK